MMWRQMEELGGGVGGGGNTLGLSETSFTDLSTCMFKNHCMPPEPDDGECLVLTSSMVELKFKNLTCDAIY